MSRELHRLARPAPALPGLRLLMAAVLVTAGRALDALAVRVMPAASPTPTLDPVLEFYADASAPEGALYVDGRLVGHLDGVTRL